MLLSISERNLAIELVRPEITNEVNFFMIIIIKRAYCCPNAGQGLISYKEGTSIDHHACSRRIDDFRLIFIISPGYLTMFSFSNVDVQVS